MSKLISSYLLSSRGSSFPLKQYLHIQNLIIFLSLTLFLAFIPFAKLPISLRSFWFSKWAMVYAGIIMACVMGIISSPMRMPKIPKGAVLFLGALFIWTFINCLSHGISVIGNTLLERIGFIILLGFFFNLFHFQALNITSVLLALTLSSSFYLAISFPVIISCLFNPEKYQELSFGFGNINMSAEYVALIFLGQLSLLPFLDKKWLIRTIEIFMCISSIYCFLSQSRSIYIIFVLGFISLYIMGFFRQYPIFKRALGLIIISLILCEIFMEVISFLKNYRDSFTTPHGTPTGHIILAKSVSDRSSLVRATISLIFDHPWGVGPGQFEFALIPYFSSLHPIFNEKLIAYSPHNEFLRWLAEDGIPHCALTAMLGVSILKGKWDQVKKLFLTQPILPLFLIYIGVQSLFQFPFQNAFPFFMTTIFLSYGVYEIYKNQTIKIFSGSKVAHVFKGIFIGTIILSCSILSSELLTFRYPFSSQKNQIAYALNPGNWYSAINKAKVDCYFKNYSQAKETLYQEVSQRPHNFIALTLLAHIHLKEGEISQACSLFRKVDNYFSNQSLNHAFIERNCP